MSLKLPPNIKLKLPPQGLMIQLFTIVLLPLIVLLLAITFGSVAVHQRAMRSLVGGRDEHLINILGRALSAQIDLRTKELSELALLFSDQRPEQVSSELTNADYLLGDYDRGMTVYDMQGTQVARVGDTQLWKAWESDPSSWQAIFSELSFNPGKIRVMKSPLDGSPTGVIAVPIGNKYLLLGAFSISNLAENSLANVLNPSNQLTVFLVDANRQLLYISGQRSDYSNNHPGIMEALQGNSGSLFINVAGDEHVTAYTPVSSAGWALVTEESWQAVITPTLQTSQVAPLVLVPAMLIMALALWLGARQIVLPLRKLEAQAVTLAGGDFKSIQEPVGGIAEIQHLQAELVAMAQKVEEAQSSLHGYIGAITAAQEEERHRLARELHDDTLQALIALKQRVQLAQLEVESASTTPAPESSEIQEISSLTEQTIQNLRRLTRALRPIYLEDLGLVPALEMLARETGQAMGITVEFHLQGKEMRLEPAIELAFYRMAQEALSNISRHAQATQASLSISFSGEMVSLKITDNGKGFKLPANPAEYAKKGHYGLLGIHERADLIGADLEIKSSPGRSTEVAVTLPLKPSEDKLDKED